MNTVYRDECGSLRGMIAHQSASERPCGWCVKAEIAARLEAEAITWRPSPVRSFVPVSASPPEYTFDPVTPAQAQANAAAAAAEAEEFERRGGANVVPLRQKPGVA